jgi:hypothetical protein
VCPESIIFRLTEEGLFEEKCRWLRGFFVAPSWRSPDERAAAEIWAGSYPGSDAHEARIREAPDLLQSR